MTDPVFRIAAPEALAAAAASGAYEGEAFDRADGFIHLSARDQVAETLALHYADAPRLAVAEIDPAALGDSLRWERSRGGALFPHAYGPIPWSAVRRVHLIRKGEDGWMLGEDFA